MSAPNFLNLTTITASNANVALSTTSATQIFSNAASSGQCYKLESLYISNASASAVTATVNYYSAATLGGTAFPIASAVSIPANSTVVIVDKNSYVYFTENTSLGVTAGTASQLTVSANYEVCS